jgi:hypothetical protein
MNKTKEPKQGIDDFHFAIARSGGDGDEAVRQLFANGHEAIEPIDPSDVERPLIHTLKAYRDAPTPTGCRVPTGQRWELDDNGRLSREGDKGPVFVATHAPLVCGVARDDEGMMRVRIAFRRREKWQERVIERSLLATPQKMGEALLGFGANLNAENARQVSVWLADFEAENEALLSEQRYVSVGGYHADGSVFVTGAGAHTAEGIDTHYIIDKDDERTRSLRAVHTRGDFETSRSMIARVFNASDEAAAMIAASLSTPLLQRLGLPSGALHLGGASSHGKTTTLQAAASIWGRGSVDDPDSFIGTFSSTAVGVEMRATVLRDLPVCLDEAHLMPAQDRTPLVYQIVGGQGKTRGRKDGGQRKTASWRTMLLTTGEGVLVPENAANGAQVRVLQLDFDGLQMDAAAVNAAKATAREHYGHLGPVFVRELLRAPIDMIREVYSRLLATSLKRAGESRLDQRQAGTIAVLATAEALGSSMFGFGARDGSTTLALLDKLSARRRVSAEWQRGLEAIAEWITSRPGEFPELVLSTNGQKTFNAEKHRVVLGYIDSLSQDEWVYLLPDASREHLERRGLDVRVVLRGLREQKCLAVDKPDEFTKRVTIARKATAVYSVAATAIFPKDAAASLQAAVPANTNAKRLPVEEQPAVSGFGALASRGASRGRGVA